MDIARRFGIGIVMIIPTFVGGGAVWSLFNSWLPVFVWLAAMIVLFGSIITGKLK